MNSQDLKQFVSEMLANAGILIGGERPWDVCVHSDDVFAPLLYGNTLALGEMYMEGLWDCERIDEMVFRLLRADLPSVARKDFRLLVAALRAHFTNPARKSHAFDVGRRHYDIGNDLYRRMLDRRMVYSCGCWDGCSDLDQAQEAKLDLICRKLRLEPGMRLLDIGGGWGSLAKFAAERFGVSVVNITVSACQIELANELTCGLPVENRLQDYRDVDETFDRMVSVGMLEHVGARNYRSYFDIARRNLSADGLFLVHTIGSAESHVGVDPWVERYVFPNSAIPSAANLARAIDGRWVPEDWHSFGQDYDPTLMAWYERFENSWDELKDSYSERFHRMWRLYLLGSAGTFRARRLQVWQILLSPTGVVGGLEPVRQLLPASRSGPVSSSSWKAM